MLARTPYPSLDGLQRKRLAAKRHKTTYCYDFPSVFNTAMRDIWTARLAAGEPGTMPSGLGARLSNVLYVCLCEQFMHATFIKTKYSPLVSWQHISVATGQPAVQYGLCNHRWAPAGIILQPS